MKGQTYVILAILCTILISVFAVLNMSVVEVNYLIWSGSSPLIFVILFSVLLGGLITMLFGTRKFIQMRKQNKELKLQIQKTELERPVKHQLKHPKNKKDIKENVHEKDQKND